MPQVSRRSQAVIPSPIRKFLPLMQQTEKRGIKIFKLSAGDPDLPPPTAILKAIKNYRQKNISYAPSPGIPEHVNAWLEYYRTFGVKLKPENVIPTVGAAEAILMALMAVADPGDEVIVFEPFYAPYKGFATMAGIKLVPVSLDFANNFSLPEASDIEAKITAKARAMVIISPNNPSGTVLSKKEMEAVMTVAEKHDLFIIADETYREIVFNRKPLSIFNFSRARHRAILIDSASKRFSSPGLRIGCLASYNEEVMSVILKMAMTRLSAPTLEQYGLIPALKNSRSYVKKIVAEYQKRRDFIYPALKKIPGIECHLPQGAFYLMAKLPVKNAEDFVRFMLKDFSYKKQTVLVVPAEDFYLTKGLGLNVVRIALVLKIKEIKVALNILSKGLAAYFQKYK